MSLVQLYKSFPSQNDCLIHLESVKWKNNPTCPYCKSTKHTPIKNKRRYHCNTCNTSYSVIVGTIFENTKLDLQKWFLSISLLANSKNKISARQLAKEINVTKDTACLIIQKIRKAFIIDNEFLDRLIRLNEIILIK
jgi:transposase-like protein